MSYQVLARKWRPNNFEELVGQQQTSQALINALDSERLHHAYLFTGTRGVGKTTIARILSKSLNCDTGITSKPCGVCSSCEEISQGTFVDLLEIDAASKTKVEDTRELLDNVQYRPTRGRYKVYLIDEVHMLSGHSFNALLKTLEEPPPHVIFLLATTDPQKMPVTVLSRCLQFHLRRMEESEIVTHLEKILNAENIEYEQGALQLIAKSADGSMRDALSLLDQAIVFSGNNIQTASVLTMLGSIDRSYAFDLLDAVSANSPEKLMQSITKIAEYAPDYDELLSDWLSLLHQIAVAQAIGHCEDKQIENLAKQISHADLQLFYQLSLHARRDLAYAPHPKQAFEMAMLRILAFKPESSAPYSPDQGKKKVKQATANELKTKETKTNEIEDNKISNDMARTIVTPIESTSSISSSNQAVAINQIEESQVNTLKKEAAELSTKPDLRLVSNIEDESLNKDADLKEDKQEVKLEKTVIHIVSHIKLSEISKENWFQVVESLDLHGPGKQILLNAIGECLNNQLQINYLTKTSSLLTDNIKLLIEQKIKTYFNQVDLKISYQKVEQITYTETPRERQIRLYNLAIDNAELKLKSDPQVNYLIENLGASLARDSIKIQDKN